MTDARAMTDKKGWGVLRKTLAALLVCVLIAGPVALAVVPTVSYAKVDEDEDMAPGVVAQTKSWWANMTEKLSGLGSFLKLALAQGTQWKSEINKLINEEAKRTAIEQGTENLAQKMKELMYDDKVTTDYLTSMIQLDGQIAAANPPSNAKTNGVCLVINARQMIPPMQVFADLVSGFIMNGLINDRAGDGPAYAARERDMACGKLNENDPKTGPLGSGCAGPTVIDPASGELIRFDDAGVSSTNLSGDTPLVMPPVEQKKVKLEDGTEISASLATAKKDSYKQQAWIAARDTCYRMMGPHPNPPPENTATTMEKIKWSAAYAHCSTLETRLLKTCADKVAYYTRPNCDVDVFKPFCEYSKNVCKAAKSFGIALESVFENCEGGLSLYEVEKVGASFCSSSGRPMVNLALGSPQGKELQTALTLCNDTYADFETKQKKLEENLTRSMAGISDINDCWADIK